MASSYKGYRRDDGIYVVYAEDTLAETVKDWEQDTLRLMDGYLEGERAIYDMRDLKGISTVALRTSIKLKAHRNAHMAYLAVVTKSERVKTLVNTVLQIQPGGNFHFVTSIEEGLDWLNSLDLSHIKPK